MTFEEVKKDYLEIYDKWGAPDDMTGGFVDSEHMEHVIRNPTKKNARDYMIKVINYGFQVGDTYRSELHGDISIHKCDLVKRLYEKYIS